MAIYQETKRVADPEALFPGVPPWRMDIAPVGPYAPKLSPEGEQLLVNITRTSNILFDEMARTMAPEQSNEFFTVHTTRADAYTLMNKTAASVYGVTKDQATVHLVFFPAGSIPIARLIRAMGYPAHRMHVLDISGSQGTESGFASIKGAVPPELLDPANTIVIPEDIGDSFKTIFAFIQERGMVRDSSLEHIDQLRTLGQRLDVAHKNGTNDPAAYADFAAAATDEHVSVLPVWSKNDQARKALLAQAQYGTSSDGSIQKELFAYYPIMPLPATLWALGGNYVMDTGVLWSRIRRTLDARLRDDPRVTQFVGPAVDGTTNEWLLRAVRIGPLAYFDPAKDQEARVIGFMANVATQMLG